MELRHLETFQAIMQEGSFVGAAEKLQYAQSTITVHIQQLEAELGVKLFARQGKHLQLTEAGRALQEQADALRQQALALRPRLVLHSWKGRIHRTHHSRDPFVLRWPVHPVPEHRLH